MDFVQFLPFELVLIILSYLVDPVDIIQFSMVSRAWYIYVIKNGVSRRLCELKTPMILSIKNIVEIEGGFLLLENRLSPNLSFHKLKQNHRMFWNLLRALFLAPLYPKDCIGQLFGASTTDDYPRESVIHTLLPLDNYAWGDSYWSTKGYSTSNINEAILLKLSGGVCIVTEIKIRPFLDDGQYVYPPRHVQFRLGHAKSHVNFQVDVHNLPLHEVDDNNYVWNYASPKYEVESEATLQSFKLPEPVLCVGGFLKIDLLGMVRREETERLYYICIGHIKVLGHSLKPAYDIEMRFFGMMSLLYTPAAVKSMIQEVAWPEDDFGLDDIPEEESAIENIDEYQEDNLWKRQVENLMFLMFGHDPFDPNYANELEDEDDYEDYDDDSNDGDGDGDGAEVGEE